MLWQFLRQAGKYEKYDEYAEASEILRLVYGTYCSIYIHSKVCEKYICGMKYGDETFPNVEPIRLLYTPDTTNSPGHYDLLVDQNTISTSHTVTDIQKNYSCWLLPLAIFVFKLYGCILNQLLLPLYAMILHSRE